MPSHYLRGGSNGRPLIVEGVHGTHYRANTVYEIDANLESIRSDHPDVDRLLDARRLVSTLNAIISPPCSLNPEQRCQPDVFEPCACARRIAREHDVD